MSGFLFLFALIVLPIFFFLMVWVTVTAYRLLRPEVPPPQADPVVVRRQAAAEGQFVPVGVREIREDQRAARTRPVPPRYHYAGGHSDGLPDAWRQDLWQRCN